MFQKATSSPVKSAALTPSTKSCEAQIPEILHRSLSPLKTEALKPREKAPLPQTVQSKEEANRDICLQSQPRDKPATPGYVCSFSTFYFMFTYCFPVFESRSLYVSQAGLGLTVAQAGLHL